MALFGEISDMYAELNYQVVKRYLLRHSHLPIIVFYLSTSAILPVT